MNSTTVKDPEEQVQVPLEIDVMLVYQACEQVQDGRHKRGVRYSVALILTLVVLGKMMGMTTPAARAQWVRLRGRWLSRVLPITRQTFPCAAT